MAAVSRRRAFLGLRAAALFEAGKGAVVLLAGFGALALVHRDAQRLAERLAGRMHLNPAHHYPRIFLDAAAHLDDARLRALAGFALLYAAVRFAEAYGLWRARRWAEWFAAVTGAIYLPFEIRGLLHGVTALRLVTFAVNLFVVAFMVFALNANGRRRADAAEPPAPDGEDAPPSPS